MPQWNNRFQNMGFNEKEEKTLVQLFFSETHVNFSIFPRGISTWNKRSCNSALRLYYGAQGLNHSRLQKHSLGNADPQHKTHWTSLCCLRVHTWERERKRLSPVYLDRRVASAVWWMNAHHTHTDTEFLFVYFFIIVVFFFLFIYIFGSSSMYFFF